MAKVLAGGAEGAKGEIRVNDGAPFKRPDRADLTAGDRVTLRQPGGGGFGPPQERDLAALEGQKQVRAFNGALNTWYCGAWMKNGFHEDGLSSAVDVANAILARDAAVPVAAE